MKIIICGKGGSGKSTLSTLLAKGLSKRGYSILMVDGDESNLGLHRLLGGKEPVNFMDSLGGKKGFRDTAFLEKVVQSVSALSPMFQK